MKSAVNTYTDFIIQFRPSIPTGWYQDPLDIYIYPTSGGVVIYFLIPSARSGQLPPLQSLHERFCSFMTATQADKVIKEYAREHKQKERDLSQIWRKGLAGGLAGCAVRKFGIPHKVRKH
jgi:hypothetical protein